MTRYTVTWFNGAQGHLSQLWMDAKDRPAVTQAANAIDRELAEDAQSKGTPVKEGLLSMHIAPLHVLFSVSEPDRLVTVASARRPAASTRNKERICLPRRLKLP